MRNWAHLETAWPEAKAGASYPWSVVAVLICTDVAAEEYPGLEAAFPEPMIAVGQCFCCARVLIFCCRLRGFAKRSCDTMSHPDL